MRHCAGGSCAFLVKDPGADLRPHHRAGSTGGVYNASEPAAAASRDLRPRQLRLWFEMDVDMEGVPNAALPGAHRAGPSSDTFEDGWEYDGWRRKLDDSEAESYMDAKFGGESADMVEGGRAALRRFARGSCSCSSPAQSGCL